MKKIMLLILLLVTILTANAEIRYYRAVHYNFRSTDQAWTGWRESNVLISINTDTRHVEIDSNTPQVIDFAALTKINGEGFTLYTADATDRKYKPMQISFQFFTDGKFFITISYSDVEYSYNVIEIDPD